MSNYGWTNEDGEPIMDGAAWRFEQQLDMDYANERAQMAWEEDMMRDYEPDGDCCDMGDYDQQEDDSWVCAYCGETVDHEDDYPGNEDAWLDGSYEE
jgi:hypothetical protein